MYNEETALEINFVRYFKEKKICNKIAKQKKINSKTPPPHLIKTKTLTFAF